MSTNTRDERYIRASMGFRDAIQGDLARDYHSVLVDAIREHGHVLDMPAFSVRLAKEFGFCYGVDKAIDLAYEARRKFPDRRIFLTTELIHNPRVNHRMQDMGIQFLSGQYKGDVGFEDITPEDVVILPAFGVSVEQLNDLRARGSILIDTTCGSVVHVWKRVEKYAKDGYTSVVHGKFYHEETIATTSHALNHGGHYIVVRNKQEAEVVCDVIRGIRDGADIAREIPNGVSKGFDPASHLQRIGVANQTTMLASESLEIAAMISAAMKERYGEDHLAEHFRSFDTICSATQDRQDAIQQLVERDHLDMLIVIGGYNSSNTNHLLELGLKYCRTFHIDDAREILSAEEIRHKPLYAKESAIAKDWLPSGHFILGVTAGASTPNRAIGETLARIGELKGLSLDDMLAHIAPQA